MGEFKTKDGKITVRLMESTILSVVLVMSGGSFGALLRFLVGQQMQFPYGTLAVNVLGSFCIGLLFFFFLQKPNSNIALFLATGLLGGFTTFSAFSLDVFKLFEAGRASFAIMYIFTSVTASVAAVFIGAVISRNITQL